MSLGSGISKKLGASGIVISRPCRLKNFLIGTDGTNDPEVTIYNGTTASGQEIVPTNTYDASALGINGAVGLDIKCPDGIYVAITCAGIGDKNGWKCNSNRIQKS
jgi:hypothetical protein